ncbi:NifX-associated nitrogen fixation protein [Oceanobacter mangrovi]|uniref:NifX-associated nitrogen fixation protein n=1 Tax=Oceanobacter mangrovi TaxID=2862510 RepID=UPI001C8D032F|nr:NifX-associated nitrogen fixation protein [Oceanobacter mangrovi]
MTEETLVEAPVKSSEIVSQIVVQLRAMDSYGTYDTWTDEKVLSPMILTKAQRREIPVVGDPDETIVSRIKAYYNAVSTLIEKECGLMAVPMINLTHEGFGRAIICVGKLIVVDKTLRDVHRFGFDSLEKLEEEVTKMTDKAVGLVTSYREVATL